MDSESESPVMVCFRLVKQNLFRPSFRPSVLRTSSPAHFNVKSLPEGVHVAQWAKRPPLNLEVPGSNPRGWFNGRAGNRDRAPLRWLETAWGLSLIRLIGRAWAQYFPGGWPFPHKKGVSISHPFAVAAMKHSVLFRSRLRYHMTKCDF